MPKKKHKAPKQVPILSYEDQMLSHINSLVMIMNSYQNSAFSCVIGDKDIDIGAYYVFTIGRYDKSILPLVAQKQPSAPQ